MGGFFGPTGGTGSFAGDIIVNGQTIGRGANNDPTNTVQGAGSLGLDISGINNTGIGDGALSHIKRGSNNTAIGAEAVSTGDTLNNTAVGSYALQQASALGGTFSAVSDAGGGQLTLNCAWSFAPAVGDQINIFDSTETGYNGIHTITAVDEGLNTITVYGIFTVTASGSFLDTRFGSDNTAVGNGACASTITGSRNTVIGSQSGALEDFTSGATRVGFGASPKTPPPVAEYVSVDGTLALSTADKTGPLPQLWYWPDKFEFPTIFGAHMRVDQKFLADGALWNYQFAPLSTAFGFFSQYANKNCFGNTSFGAFSLQNAVGDSGTFNHVNNDGGNAQIITSHTGSLVGGEVLVIISKTGAYTSFAIVLAVVPNISITVSLAYVGSDNGIWSNIDSGDRNTAIGFNVLHAVTTGSQNTAIGDSSGWNIVTGNGNLLAGGNAGESLGDVSNVIALAAGGADKIVYQNGRLKVDTHPIPYILDQNGNTLAMMGVAATFTGPYTITDEGGNVGITGAGAHGLTAAAAVGNSIHVSGGTNWTPGFYTITALDADTIGTKITIALVYDAGLGSDVVVDLAGVEVFAYQVVVPGGALGPNGSLEHRYLFFANNNSGLNCGFNTYFDSTQYSSIVAAVQFTTAGIDGFANTTDETSQWVNTVPGSSGLSITGGDYRKLMNVDSTIDKVYSVTFVAGGANDMVSFNNHRVTIYPG